MELNKKLLSRFLSNNTRHTLFTNGWIDNGINICATFSALFHNLRSSSIQKMQSIAIKNIKDENKLLFGYKIRNQRGFSTDFIDSILSYGECNFKFSWIVYKPFATDLPERITAIINLAFLSALRDVNENDESIKMLKDYEKLLLEIL